MNNFFPSIKILLEFEFCIFSIISMITQKPFLPFILSYGDTEMLRKQIDNLFFKKNLKTLTDIQGVHCDMT